MGRASPSTAGGARDYSLAHKQPIRAAGIERREVSGSQIFVRMSNGQSQAGDLPINPTGPAASLMGSCSGLSQNLLRRSKDREGCPCGDEVEEQRL